MNKTEMILGAKQIAPLLIGAVPFGMSTGLYSVESGFSVFESFMMSVFIFAGASQVATVSLLSTDAPFWIVIATAALINLRFLIYSATVSPFIHKASVSLRTFMAYAMTDHAFIITTREKYIGQDRASYFLGASILVWIVWQTSFLLGSLFGKVIPDSWSLEFSLPLVFLFFTVPLLKSKENVIAASVAALSAIIFVPLLPIQSGLIVSILCGAFAGIAAKKFFNKGAA
jgi:4-azaleucine resistance transporter AzlC